MKPQKQTNSYILPLAYILLLCLFCLLLSIATGCGSAYRSASKPFIGYSSFAPTIIISPAFTTNQPGSAVAPITSPLRDDQRLTATARIQAPLIICAEQLYLSFYGGSATSNSVLSDLQIPLTGAP